MKTLKRFSAKGELLRSLNVHRAVCVVRRRQFKCLHSRGHNIDVVFLKLAQNVCLDNILVKFDHGWDGMKKLSWPHFWIIFLKVA